MMKSLQFKIIFLFLLLVVISTASSAFIIFVQGGRVIRQRIELQLESILKLKQYYIENFSVTGIKSAEAIAKSEMVRSYMKELSGNSSPLALPHDSSILQSLREQLSYVPFFEIFLINLNGSVVLSTDQSQEGKVKSNDIYFIQGKSGTYIQNFYFDLALRQSAITVSTPIKDGYGKVIGVLAGRIDGKEINRIMTERAGLGDTGETYIVNSFNYIVTDSRFQKDYALKKTIFTEATADCLRGKSGFGSYLNYLGTPVIGSYKWIPDRSVCLLAEISQIEGLEPVNTLRNIVVLSSLLSAILAIILGIFSSKGIINPLIRLRDASILFGKGKFNEKVKVETDDEIGQLSNSFNNMAGELGLLYAGLEDRIRERTKEIQDEKNKLEVTLESIGDGAFSINSSGQIVFFNKVAEQISGYTREEVIGKHYKSALRFILEKDNSENYQFIENSLSKGVISYISNHTILIAKNGAKIPVEDSAAPLKDASGRTVGVVVIFRDVTKSRDIEKTKTNFLSIASHQLRTPLTALRWTTEMFLSGDLGVLTVDQKKFVGDMYKSIRRLLDLINIFLISSRVEESRIDIKPVPVDTIAVTQEVIASLEPLIKAKKINIAIVKQQLPQINLELEMFRQVILNLISNAINYTPNGGTISVEFKLNDEQVICSVRDNGIGIPKKDQYKIFQKFFRADNAVAVITDGSGLGLNLIKSIVESWNGKVYFDSEEGKGTIFYFTIPLIGMKSKVGEVKINE